ncbi:MAG: undecaprenyldiphospho-muramoylpentapeptide beta-N-acetylglucosaminyltransferase [Clostridia bacterium]|nr:undecaprenyldiphospho-muramoylpentapeptide beta-N-acetylglucosaminyltransferase [Clostridia bacterium]
MRILLAGGGTAGHINPAVAIADYACKKDNNTEILFIGTEKGMESTLVPESGYDIKFVKVQGLSKKLTVENMKSLWYMITAKKRCKKIIREFKPDIVIGTGGYVCAPAVMAANSLGIPTLIHEQNVFPGSAVKLLSKKSSVTAISFEDSRKHLDEAKEIIFSGNPIRPEMLSCDRKKAREGFGLIDEKLIMIFGGSLGANAINSVALDYVQGIDDKNIKVLFGTGNRNYEEIITSEAGKRALKNKNVSIVAYIHNMNEAMNAADVVVCRSGAITVSELCALGKPSILIPSPNVTNNHQEYNARALSDKGAAITILEKDFSAESLREALDSLLNNSDAIENMSKKAIELSSVNALDIIYKKITELVM